MDGRVHKKLKMSIEHNVSILPEVSGTFQIKLNHMAEIEFSQEKYSGNLGGMKCSQVKSVK